ncbi:hypothetical protein CN204_24705 [Sinorhizobium meliloti]|nr:hypothetical protein CN222_04625 [Sinorhizobium meliloti]RVG96842.1 hypothetical protein CN221_10675 [Sinorhizobium meliloti]RVH03233.1 hypothetical protein CN210_20405 [Sinorhizobium meliloti]RVH19727.1 hypothetical protein CN216_05235 [Sinorhizobium meliloti]RVH22888.1 hypothetical protein CN215_21310 [Sinorhizobium meliloti]
MSVRRQPKVPKLNLGRHGPEDSGARREGEGVASVMPFSAEIAPALRQIQILLAKMRAMSTLHEQ